ncbi:hypothetical protein SAM9427_12430, partial [Streptomyces sp. ETH9427]
LPGPGRSAYELLDALGTDIRALLLMGRRACGPSACRRRGGRGRTAGLRECPRRRAAGRRALALPGARRRSARLRLRERLSRQGAARRAPGAPVGRGARSVGHAPAGVTASPSDARTPPRCPGSPSWGSSPRRR